MDVAEALRERDPGRDNEPGDLIESVSIEEGVAS
jgi:hypothetical protein